MTDCSLSRDTFVASSNFLPKRRPVPSETLVLASLGISNLYIYIYENQIYIYEDLPIYIYIYIYI